MRLLGVFLGLFALTGYSLDAPSAAAWGNDVYTSGYYRSNGTYVDSHYRTKADGYSSNNYSYSGNINPYTGAVGTKNSSFDSYSYTPKSTYSSTFNYNATPSYSSSGRDYGLSHPSRYDYSPGYSSSSSYGYGNSSSWSRPSSSSSISSSSSSWSGLGSTASSAFSSARGAFDRLSFRW